MNIAQVPPLPAIVDGTVWHARTAQLNKSFSHHAYLWLVDIDDLPNHGILANFDVRDHLGSPNETLRHNVETFVRAQGIDGPLGQIVMLAAARVAGYVFDPISVFWCFDPDGELACIVAEVHNTYGERDAYLLQPDDAGRAQTDKRFYVSPFFDVSGQYRMTFTLDEAHVGVHINLYQGDEHVFSASFEGAPQLATRRLVRSTSVRQPFMPQRVTALIRMHGIHLWARRLPLINRPEHTPAAGVAPTVDDAEATEPWNRVPQAPRSPFREAVARRLAKMAARRAGVTLLEPGESAASSPALTVTPQAYARLGVSPKVGLAEGYIAGDWAEARGTDLADALEPFAARLTSVLPGWAWRLRWVTDISLPRETRNDRHGSRRNIEAHYDLSNDLFEHFLDAGLNYSSALFDPQSPDDDLAAAQLRKLDAVLDLADVRAGTSLLEIGSGWGALAIRAAERGARVVSITLSSDQLAVAKQRAEAAGVSDHVEFRLQDYRDVRGEFDAIVSIEMIEAVGEEYWADYLRVLHDRLAPGGKAAIQAITMDDDRMRATRKSHGWVQEYIFPGGLIPSVEGLRRAAGTTPITISSVRSFSADYARTLHLWRQRFTEHWPAIEELGFNERFRRMWTLYLAYCEAGFKAGYLDVEHLRVERTA